MTPDEAMPQGSAASLTDLGGDTAHYTHRRGRWPNVISYGTSTVFPPENIGALSCISTVTTRGGSNPVRIAGGPVYFASRPRQARARRSNQFTAVNAVLSGALQSLSDILLQPVIFLSAIAYVLGASSYQVAGFAVASLATWSWAGAIVSPLRMLLRRDYHLVVAGGAIRVAAAIAIGILGYRLPNAVDADLVPNLLIAYAVYQLASAVTGRATALSTRGGISMAAQRGLYRKRALTGVIVAVIGGAVAWSTLGSRGTAGENASILLILAAIGTAAATWFLLAIPGPRRIDSLASFRGNSVEHALTTLRSDAFRRYLVFRGALAMSAVADPFLIVFGLSELGLTLGEVGAAMAIYAVGHLAGILIWPRWIASRSSRGPLQMTSLLRLMALVIAVSIPSISTSGLYAGRFDGPDVAVRCFIALFGLLGLVASASIVSNQPYLLDIFPADLSGSAISLTNAVMGVIAFGPLGAAYIVNRFSLEATLYVAIAVAFVALLTSGLLVESRVEARQRFGSRRVQRRMSRTAA